MKPQFCIRRNVWFRNMNKCGEATNEHTNRSSGVLQSRMKVHEYTRSRTKYIFDNKQGYESFDSCGAFYGISYRYLCPHGICGHLSMVHPSGNIMALPYDDMLAAGHVMWHPPMGTWNTADNVPWHALWGYIRNIFLRTYIS